jgi:hypothetical protein
MSTAAAQGMPLSFREVLRIPVMRRVWYAQVISPSGDFLALFAAPTHSPATPAPVTP